MKFLKSSPGETVYDFLNKALSEAEHDGITILATHNDIDITVYPQSCIQDLCDKYDLTKRLAW